MLPYFIYASISSGKTLDAVKANLDNSRIYQKTMKNIEAIPFLFNKPEENATRDSFNVDYKDPDGTLFIDFLMNRDKRHRKLDKIIEYVKQYHKNNGFVIVVQNIGVFGNVAQIQFYYRLFQENNIYVLCIDYSRFSGLSEYSTSDFGFDKRCIDEYERAYTLVNALTPDSKALNKRGAISTFSKAFIKSYWMYETYQVPENIAIAASGLARSPFHRKCALYEYSAGYQHDMDNIYICGEKIGYSALAELAKRFSTFPASQFKELEQLVDAEWNNDNTLSDKDIEEINKIMDNACIKLGIPSMHPINYKRIKLSQTEGRKEIAKSYKKYDKNIIQAYEAFSLNPDNDPKDFWNQYNSHSL